MLRGKTHVRRLALMFLFTFAAVAGRVARF